MKARKKIGSLRQVLREFQAILALEEEAALTYQQLAQDCPDEEAKKILFQISEEEFSHRKIAQKLVELAAKALKKKKPSRKKLHEKKI